LVTFILSLSWQIIVSFVGTLQNKRRVTQDDEVHSIEELLADFLEAKALFGAVSAAVAGSVAAVGKLHKLVVLSEGILKDATFARLVRRKFV
jgi:hypothetical protein